MNSTRRLRTRAWSIFLIAVSFLVLGHAPTAFAYAYSTCDGSRLKWNNSRANMFISTRSFPVGSEWDKRLQNAMWHWNNVKSSSFNFYVGRDTDTTYSSNNLMNEVVLGNVDGPSGTLAVTKLRYKCVWAPLRGWDFGLVETDVVFDAAEFWSPVTASFPNGGELFLNFEGVALHEFGHVLGLNHENRRLATMNSYYPHGGTLGHYKEWDPLPDDRQGARFLYGGDGTRETDIAASIFKSTSAGGSGWVNSPTSATRGSTITFEYTLANQSTSAPSFEVAFYLSSDATIGTDDIYLGSSHVSGGSAGYVVTWSRSVTIPSWISPGAYRLGVLVDPNNTLVENNETNGFQEMDHAIRID